jgi:transposase, IS5 family
MEQQIGVTLNRILADAGYRGHNAPPDYRFKVYTAGQKRRMTGHIRRQLRRRSAVEPVIGHLKDDHRMDRNYLAHRLGDANNAVLAAVGYNFRRLLALVKAFAARRPLHLGPVGPADLSYQSWLIGLLHVRLRMMKIWNSRS